MEYNKLYGQHTQIEPSEGGQIYFEYTYFRQIIGLQWAMLRFGKFVAAYRTITTAIGPA